MVLELNLATDNDRGLEPRELGVVCSGSRKSSKRSK
jgi:hypothetical protein